MDLPPKLTYVAMYIYKQMYLRNMPVPAPQ